MANILVAEDDKLLNKGVTYALAKEHRVTSVFSYKEVVDALKKDSVDLILLDITLPDGDGVELCKEIRKCSLVPVIFVTAKDTPNDSVVGFLAGCDDYISKPFDLEVLRQRIRAVLRRAQVKNSNLIQSGSVTIDFDKCIVQKNQVEIHLTATEFKLLQVLVENKKQVMTRSLLLEKLWDVDQNFVDENTLNVNIRRLRQKLEDDPKKPEYIRTVFGIGYTWG